jgi:hypothetical protein
VFSVDDNSSSKINRSQGQVRFGHVGQPRTCTFNPAHASELGSARVKRLTASRPNGTAYFRMPAQLSLAGCLCAKASPNDLMIIL